MRQLAAFLLFWTLTASAQSGLSVAPIRLQIAPGTSSTSFTATDAGAQPKLLQITIRRWTRVQGEDRYEDSESPIATPPLFHLSPDGGSQVVRIGFVTPPPASAIEQAWRVFLEEVPNEADPPKPGEVRLQLRLGLPLFVPPAAPKHQLDWRLVRQNGQVQLQAANRGNVHERIDQLALHDPGDQPGIAQWPGPLYVFPGETRVFVLDTSRLPDKTAAVTLHLHAQGSGGQTDHALALPGP